MTYNANFTTHDFRSSVQDSKRFQQHKEKWDSGAPEAIRISASGKKRPARRFSAKQSACHRKENEKDMHRAKVNRKQDPLAAATIAEDSSGDEKSISRVPSSPMTDEDIAYSYDSARGPVEGNQVLGQALALAVERFENHQTEKLVKDEYEVLDTANAEDDTASPQLFDDGDEDFEFV